MKPYRVLSKALLLCVLALILFGCRDREAERRRQEQRKYQTDRVDQISKRLEDINMEIDRLDKSLDSLNSEMNNYMFKIKISLVTLKDSQRDIRKATDELKAQLAPPEKEEESKPYHWFITFVILGVVVLAVIYLVRIFHTRREEEEVPFEEPPFETRSPYENTYDRGFEPFEDERE